MIRSKSLEGGQMKTKEMLFVHYFQQKESDEWRSEEIIATCEIEARHKLRTMPGKHDPEKMFDSAIDRQLLTMTALVRIHTHRESSLL